LIGRGDTSNEAIEKRLKIAENELTYTFKPNYFDHIVINEDKNFAVHHLARAINESQSSN
jgi:guanylate kinase